MNKRNLKNINVPYPESYELNEQIQLIQSKLLNKKGTKINIYKKWVFTSFVLLILSTSVFLGWEYTKYNMSPMSSKPDIVTYADERLYVDQFSNIFIGEIVEYHETKQYYGGEGFPIPYSFYTVKVIHDLKGESSNNETIVYYGGPDFFGRLFKRSGCQVIMTDNDKFLPQIGQTYLFFVNPYEGEDTRTKMGNYHIMLDQQMKLLPQYEKEKIPSEQVELITGLLDYYTKMVDESINFELGNYLLNQNTLGYRYEPWLKFRHDDLNIRIYRGLDINYSVNSYLYHSQLETGTVINLIQNGEIIMQHIVQENEFIFPITDFNLQEDIKIEIPSLSIELDVSSNPMIQFENINQITYLNVNYESRIEDFSLSKNLEIKNKMINLLNNIQYNAYIDRQTCEESTMKFIVDTDEGQYEITTWCGYMKISKNNKIYYSESRYFDEFMHLYEGLEGMYK